LGGFLACDTTDESKDGADADTDTDTDTDSDVDCNATYSTPSPGVCLTETLGCGETIYATNDGGSTYYDYSSFSTGQCLDWALSEPSSSYDGPERVYEINVPGGQYGQVDIDSPCETLDSRLIHTESECPSSIGTCRAPFYDGPTKWEILTFKSISGGSAGERYEVVVDSYGGVTGNFSISLDCF